MSSISSRPMLRRMKSGETPAAASSSVESWLWVVLAGWMHLLSDQFLSRFPARVVNLHPALPGTFPGTHAIERAYAAYQRGEITHTGIMVHLVPDEAVDAGPVVAQEEIPILPADSLPDLEERVHAVEHRLLVQALRRLLC